MNIYDCFMYFDEDMLLDLRLNILNDYVEKFIITEATYTHNGSPKKLNFNISNFKKFKDKIEYIVVDKQPPSIIELDKKDSPEERGRKLIINGYARDNFQRDNLNKGLQGLKDDDLILISDLDEIPNLSKVNFNNLKQKIIIFTQKMFYYKLNLVYENFKWNGTKGCKKKHFISPQWLRDIKAKKYSRLRFDLLFSKRKYSDISFVENGGWHFTCMRSAEELEKKLRNFAHHYDFEESGLSLKDLKKFIDEKKVMYDHQLDQRAYKWSGGSKLKKIQSTELPLYINQNSQKFINWLD